MLFINKLIGMRFTTKTTFILLTDLRQGQASRVSIFLVNPIQTKALLRKERKLNLFCKEKKSAKSIFYSKEF